ncbi:hypothetical protein B0O80DRAFT_440542 [Mortierella sp. GBAus27b]|nr:hypothetical protein B0O80DRAFT_440542 [Mortierella sp. GBAus27b]
MASAVSLPPTTSTPTSPTSPLPYTLHPTGIMAPRYTPMADKSTARLIPVASPPYSQVAPGSASSFALARAPAPHSKSVAASSAPQPPQQARIMNGTTPLPAGRPVSDATLVQRLQDYNNTISELETENMTPPHTPTSYVQGGEKMLQELQASPHPRAMLMRRMSTDDNEGMDIYFCNSIPVTSSFFADMETGHLKSDSNSVPPLPTSAAGAAGAASSHWSQGQQYLTPPK